MWRYNAPRIIFACLAFWLSSSGAIQEQAVVPRYALEIAKETPLGNLSAATLMLPHRCDTKGNLYIRFHTGGFGTPILKFTSDGERKAQFSTESVKDWEGAEILEYAIGLDGQVYLLVDQFTEEKKIEFGVLTFGEDGRHRFSIRLNPAFDSIDHLVVLSSGAFLVVGFRKIEEASPRIPGTPVAEQKKTKPSVEPVLLVVNRSGEVAAEVPLLSGSTSGQPDETAQKLKLPASAVNRASMVAGDDGNVYLLFPDDKPTIYVVSASGEVIRTLKVDPPTDKAVPLRLALAPGVGLLLTSAEKLEQEFGASYPSDKTFFSLVNPETGERLYDYQSSTKLGGGLACYTPQGMVFLGNSDRKLVIRKATFR